MTGGPDTRQDGERSSAADPEPVVIRDRRRIDPDSGAVRAPVDLDPVAAAGDEPPGPVEPVDREAALLADLQRERAQFLNYKRRTESDALAVVERSTALVLELLLPLLDDVERARQHGDLTGAFKGVGEGLEGVLTRLGVERFGVTGEVFDPNQHEALMQAEPDPTSPVPVCAQVLQQGYRMRSGRVLRPARVAVAEGSGTAGDPGTAAPDG